MSAGPHDDSVTIPSGTITFVFTDIEGSTQRWDRDRAAMESAVRRHDALMREAIAAHRGYVFKTIGDAFCAAFSRPEDAVAAMFDAQRALGAEDFSAVGGIRVRAAIHTGTADERDRDYFGPAVNRVARLLAIGHGGQVLVSGVTTDLVQGSLPPQASLRDLGEHRLKDLSRPEYVYQLLGPGIVADFPPLRSLAAMPNNLPRNTTSFVGRDAEIAELTALLAEHRLVTLVGSGGLGKTRTSLHVAANLLDGSGDGVWFIELAPLSSGEYVPATVAKAMGQTLPADGDPIENLVRLLKTKRALLVFDNCEHLIDASATIVAAILRECSEIRVLASSRQALGIAGERAFRMPSLAVPSAAEAASLTAPGAAAYAALALFNDRARAADHRFTLTDENAPVVAEICRALDGIPFAIELAAARMKFLSPKQVRDRLDERFRLLTGGNRDVLPRQQTLRALIDWSHDLLGARERIVFRRLGIFVGSFGLECAAAVVSDEDLDPIDVFDILASLVDKSLVLAESGGEAVRYRLLQSTLTYAVEKLRDAGERDLLAGRHLRYLRDWFVEMWERQDATARDTELGLAFSAELEGLRFALDDALVRSDCAAGAELLAATGITWMQQNVVREGTVRCRAYLAALPDDEVLLRAKISALLVSFLGSQGMFAAALELAADARVLARKSGDGSTYAFATRGFAVANMMLGNLAEADAALNDAAAIPALSARQRVLLTGLRLHLSQRIGDLDAAARGFEQFIEEHRALGNFWAVHSNLLHLADLEHARGRTARAIALTRDALPALQSAGDRADCAHAFANLAGFLVASDDLPATVEAARQTIGLLALEPDHILVVAVVEDLALVEAHRGGFARAARLAAYADVATAAKGAKRQFAEQSTHDRLTALLDANLTPEERVRLTAEGAALGPEAAVALALEVTCTDGDRSRSL